LKRRDEILRKTHEEKEVRLAKKYEKISHLQQVKYQRQQDVIAHREQVERDRSLNTIQTNVNLPVSLGATSRNVTQNKTLNKSPLRGSQPFGLFGRHSVVPDTAKQSALAYNGPRASTGLPSSRSSTALENNEVTPNRTKNASVFSKTYKVSSPKQKPLQTSVTKTQVGLFKNCSFQPIRSSRGQ
jgi:hypothetical protein